MYLFMKVSFSSDLILSGWLGSKHQLTNFYLTSICYAHLCMHDLADQ